MFAEHGDSLWTKVGIVIEICFMWPWLKMGLRVTQKSVLLFLSCSYNWRSFSKTERRRSGALFVASLNWGSRSSLWVHFHGLHRVIQSYGYLLCGWTVVRKIMASFWKPRKTWSILGSISKIFPFWPQWIFNLELRCRRLHVTTTKSKMLWTILTGILKLTARGNHGHPRVNNNELTFSRWPQSSRWCGRCPSNAWRNARKPWDDCTNRKICVKIFLSEKGILSWHFIGPIEKCFSGCGYSRSIST